MMSTLPVVPVVPFRGRMYIASVTLAGAAVMAFCLQKADFLYQPGLFAALIALACVTAALDLKLPFTASGSSMSVAYAVDFASLLLLGPHEAMVVSAASALAACRLNKKVPEPVPQTLFSMAVMVLTVQGAGLALGWLSEPGSAPTLATIGRPLLATATVYALISTGLVATALALSSNTSIVSTWKAGALTCAPGTFVGACTAAIGAALVSKTGYWIMPLGFAPIYLTYRTYKVYRGRIEDEQRHVQQTSDLHLATIEALARAIDAKDQNTQTHIRRVQTYAARMAKSVGLSPSEIQCVKTAALLHDIGKLAVPEHILSKPGPLTQEEFQKIRIHPEVGAEIIAAVPFPYPVAPIILSHHERWDGKGYPQGLKGEQIPIGARILTIVDYYDAITTERPYHKALPRESAVGLLRHESGLALDPTLVRVFIELLPVLVAEDDAETEAREAKRAEAVSGHAVPAQGPAAAIAATNNAFENIALAHREIYALYEIAQSMGTSLGVADTMALISSKLINIIPWSGSALFLMNGTDSLKCRFASGADASQLLNVTVKLGEGLSGWVAKNRRTLVNADPRVTFELAGLPEPRLRSALVCPLYVNDSTFIGCLALYHLEANRYSDDHRRLLERIAEQAGPVIHNSIVFEQTQEDSLTDPLTGLPNRRSMFVHLSRELSRAERLKREMALIVMDLDGFKTINDTYGHHVGDRALREMSLALQGTLRPYDLCVRYAGDEFIVVLTDCSREAAELKRHELQERIGQIEIEVRTGKRLRLAASAGAAVFPHDGTSYEMLLAEADHRMYRDKAQRRGTMPSRRQVGPEFAADFDAPAAAAAEPLALAPAS